MSSAQVHRMRTFYLIWFGQLISLIGSSLTSFGLGVWVFERTGSATEFTLIAVAAFLPAIVVSPLAGALVDRHDRRKVMIAADLAAGLSTVAVTLLLLSGRIEVWHIYITSMISSAASAFQSPAYSAAITQLVPKSQYSRAISLVTGAEGAARVLAPALAGALIGVIGLAGIIAIDFASFLFAVGTLLFVRFPSYQRIVSSAAASVWQEALHGWRFLTERRGLFATILFFAFLNFTLSMVSQLLVPMVLSFAGSNQLGIVVAMGGAGVLAGSAILAGWRGPRRKMVIVYGFGMLQGATMLLIGWRESIVLIGLARLLLSVGSPIVNGTLHILLQRKVPAGMQGRVFSTVHLLAWFTIPAAYVLSGPLADHVFGPMLLTGGALAGSVGAIIGVGDGRGMGLMFILFGVLTLIGTGAALLYGPMRRVERELPDVTPDDLPPPDLERESEPTLSARNEMATV